MVQRIYVLVKLLLTLQFQVKIHQMFCSVVSAHSQNVPLRFLTAALQKDGLLQYNFPLVTWEAFQSI